MCFGVLLWILCWHFVKKRREERNSAMRATNSPPVYVIPIYEEEREDEEVMDIYEARFGPPYRDPPMYSSRNVSPPPPYRVQSCAVHMHTFTIICDEAVI